MTNDVDEIIAAEGERDIVAPMGPCADSSDFQHHPLTDENGEIQRPRTCAYCEHMY